MTTQPATCDELAALRAEIRADLRAFNRNMIIGFIVTNIIIVGVVAVAVQIILAAIPNP